MCNIEFDLEGDGGKRVSEFLRSCGVSVKGYPTIFALVPTGKGHKAHIFTGDRTKDELVKFIGNHTPK